MHDDDIITIGLRLFPGEIFEGFHEAHGSRYQQIDHPMVRVTYDNIFLVADLREDWRAKKAEELNG